MGRPAQFPIDGGSSILPGAELCLLPGWLQAGAADSLLRAMQERVEWEVHRIRMFGRVVDSPRLSSWIGDPGLVYRYSGACFEPRSWPQPLLALRARLCDELGTDFNSILANRYRSGADYMGWHSDDEPELGPYPVIASLSLGATRRFLLRHRHDHSLKAELALEHGSLLLMRGETQRLYRHSLPRTVRPVEERVNLTFRRIFSGPINPGQDERRPPVQPPASSR